MSSISSTTATACECCAPPLQCRTRGGTASMIGQRGLSSAVPPNFYTTITYNALEGDIQYYTSRDKSCSGSAAGAAEKICNLSGVGTFVYDCDPDFQFWSGSLTSTSTFTGCSTRSISPLGGMPACDGKFLTCSDTGDTTRTATTAGTCLDSGSLGTACGVYTDPTGVDQIFGKWPCAAGGGTSPGEDVKATAGGGTVVLSDLDTQDAAILRLQDCSAWSSWVPASSTTCMARYQTRTGSSWTYKDAEWQVSKTGLLPSHTYTVAVTMQRSVFGASSFSLYSTDTVPATTDGSGAFTVTGSVPNDEGFDTYADTVTITP